jgi:hypothetical protein
MAVTAFVYANFIEAAFAKQIDAATDTFKLLLATSAYSPNQDTDTTSADVVDSTAATAEVSGGGYTSGGYTITNVTVALDTSANKIVIDGDDIAETNCSFTARYGLINDSTADRLAVCVDFGEDESPSAGNFSLTWSSDGIINIGI